MDFIRRTWAEIDLDALDYNIKSIKAKMMVRKLWVSSKPIVMVMAMVL